MSFAGNLLSVLFCMLSMLISDSRFDLVWFRVSCDHGWIRSGSVNVRKQQQQTFLFNKVGPTNLMSRMNGKKTHTHTHSGHWSASLLVLRACVNDVRKIKIGKSKIKNKHLIY